MATAECLNDDCEKGEWRLQKHPDDYARGVSCPVCGTTRVDVETEEGDDAQRAPDTRSGGQQERAPATEQQASGPDDLFGSLVAVADDDVDNRVRAEGAANLLSTAGGLVKRFVDYQEQKREAKEARAESVDLEPARDLPECVECGHQFTGDDIGLNTERVVCPECQAVYDIRE